MNKKSSGRQVEINESIGTPGDAPGLRRKRQGSTTLGDKSMFSITPFLNRTSGAIPNDFPQSAARTTARALPRQERPKSILDGDVSEDGAIINDDQTREQTGPPTRPPITNGRKTLGRKTALSSQHITRIAEEPDDHNVAPPHIEGSTFHAPGAGSHTGPAKKKRKIFGNQSGTTIFDDDEGQTAKRLPASLNAARLNTARGTAVLAPGLTKLQPVPQSSALNQFSPLKKNRKPVAA